MNGYLSDAETTRWRAEREKAERDKRAKALRHPKADEFAELVHKATEAGRAAAAMTRPTPMIVERRANPLDDTSAVEQAWFVADGVCGFAGVRIRPGTSAFARWLVNMGLAYKSYSGGVETSVHEYNQSMQLKEAHARAYAEVLREAGITASSWSRMD